MPDRECVERHLRTEFRPGNQCERLSSRPVHGQSRVRPAPRCLDPLGEPDPPTGPAAGGIRHQTRRGSTPRASNSLAEADDFVVHVDVASWGTFARVAASTPGVAEEVGTWLRDRLGSAEGQQVDAVIWHGSRSGGSYVKQRLSPRHWVMMERNYPPHTRDLISSLIRNQRPPAENGRLILFHGESGTGKTNAIRALMGEWAPWCDLHVVTDPDLMFSSARYLLDVIEKSPEVTAAPTLTSVPDQERWKLVIAEDADAYVQDASQNHAGGALGRLLNTTDGLLAQSARLLLLLTTNRPLRRLHPAIARPGRCLSKIEFGRFSVREATTWLGEPAPELAGPATLAELYQIRRTGLPPTPEVVHGMYL